jgi:hypothetical protein
MKHIYTVLVCLLWLSRAAAQTEDFQPDMSRALFHHRLDKAQSDLLARDGKADDKVTADKDEEINLQLTYQATTRVDKIQKEIEFSKTFDNNQKITFLRGLTDLLNDYSYQLATKNMKWNQLQQLLSGYDESINLYGNGQSILPAIHKCKYMVAKLIAKNIAFASIPDMRQVRGDIFLKYIKDNPNLLLRELNKDSDYDFTDSLISAAARKVPEELFSYAQARKTTLGSKIVARGKTDPLVKMIVELSGQNSGQLFFPFLDRMSSGELSRDEVAKAVSDSTDYYKLLVETQISYAGRVAKGDTPVVMKGLENMLRQKSYDLYVNTINGLHDSPNNIRFRKIQGLGPKELYYLVVMNESTIYTSSYMYVYNRIFEVMPNPSSDTLLAMVNNDKYKKFLTMASNYNTLDDFLGKMSRESATTLMTNFVSNLEKGKTIDDIEDAVDVANAYASIKQADIRALMLKNVRANLDAAMMQGNKKGIMVYHIEKLIMESNDSISTVNLTDSLGIPPVYEVKNDYMRDSLGRIILQMYFYGDKGGKGSFDALVRLYSDRKKWEITSDPNWVKFTSIGTPVPFIMFANRALDEEKDLDEEAQRNLIKYMNENGYKPSLTVHRGHSYYLKYTIQKMLPSSKVVILGSCGAYQNLSEILKISPEAYIISSKQVGYGEINIPLFSYLIENLKNGKDIQWPTMMDDVRQTIRDGLQESYEDYVFPHRNLGALFIKAYKIALQQDGGEMGLSQL